MDRDFSVGLTRDFIGPDGRMTYKDIGLGLLDVEPQCANDFLAEHHTPVQPQQIAHLDAVLSLTPSWNNATFEQGAERLAIVARFGVGYDMCDVPMLTANDVLLTITPGATDHPVAGGVLGMMLAMSRRLFAKDRLVREGRWSERANFQGTEIGGKMLGIVGFGGAGRRLARLVEPFEMQVIVHDPFVSDEILAKSGAVRAASLQDLFARSDYISIHCMLNDETRGLINADLFGRMKPTAYFFNAARGPIVNERDLIDALRTGKFAGAGLDCFEEEPPKPDNPLLTMDNVLLAPHAVCWTDECFQAIGESAVRSILSVKRGEVPFGLLNPEVLQSPGFKAKAARLRERLG